MNNEYPCVTLNKNNGETCGSKEFFSEGKLGGKEEEQLRDQKRKQRKTNNNKNKDQQDLAEEVPTNIACRLSPRPLSYTFRWVASWVTSVFQGESISSNPLPTSRRDYCTINQQSSPAAKYMERSISQER